MVCTEFLDVKIEIQEKKTFLNGDFNSLINKIKTSLSDVIKYSIRSTHPSWDTLGLITDGNRGKTGEAKFEKRKKMKVWLF